MKIYYSNSVASNIVSKQIDFALGTASNHLSSVKNDNYYH